MQAHAASGAPVDARADQRPEVAGGREQQVAAGAQQQQQQAHRPSLFAAPFAPAPGAPATSGASPLTNHEVYELIQQHQQQQAAQSAPANSSKPAKRRSLYVQMPSQRHALERQASVIVGTPGFRERYDSNVNKYAQYVPHTPQQQLMQPPSPFNTQVNMQHQHQQHQQPANQNPMINQTGPMQAPPQLQQTLGPHSIMMNQQQAKMQQQRPEDTMQASPSPVHHHHHHPHFTGYDINSTSGEATNVCAIFLTALSLVLVLATFPISLFLCIKVVQEYERVVIFRLGRLLKGGARGPGIFFIIPCIDTYCKVDLRTVSFDVPPQEILSKDSVTVAVDAVVYYRISNATIAVSNVEDYGRSTRLLAATTLRNVLGTKNLSEILSERETISHIMQSSLDEATEPWGVKVERVEIKDVRLPVQLQRAMAAEAEAAREARAKVIAAEGEQKASKALRNAAEVIAVSPQAIQLRYLQTLNSIAAEKNSTIVFPLPIDFLSNFSPRQCQLQHVEPQAPQPQSQTQPQPQLQPQTRQPQPVNPAPIEEGQPLASVQKDPSTAL